MSLGVLERELLSFQKFDFVQTRNYVAELYASFSSSVVYFVLRRIIVGFSRCIYVVFLGLQFTLPLHRLLINPLPPTSLVSVPTHHFLVILDVLLVASNQKQEPLVGEPGEIVPLRD